MAVETMEQLLTNRLKELSEAVDAFVSNGGPVAYADNEDSVGHRTCCYKRSYEDHSEDCEWLLMKRSNERAQVVLEGLK